MVKWWPKFLSIVQKAIGKDVDKHFKWSTNNKYYYINHSLFLFSPPKWNHTTYTILHFSFSVEHCLFSDPCISEIKPKMFDSLLLSIKRLMGHNSWYKPCEDNLIGPRAFRILSPVLVIFLLSNDNKMNVYILVTTEY